MTALDSPSSGARGAPGRPRPGGQGRNTDPERLLGELTARLTVLAVADVQHDVIRALHGAMAVGVLRRAGSALTVRDVAVRTGLPAYLAEAALNLACDEGGAQRDTTGPAWLYTATEPPGNPAEEDVKPPGQSPERDELPVAAQPPEPGEGGGDGHE